MKNSCPQWDSNPLPFTNMYELSSLSVRLLDVISIKHFKVDHLFPECAINIYLYIVPRCRCSKMFVMYYILLNLDI